MADLGFMFQPGQFDAFNEYTTVPKGKFHAVISSNEIDRTDKDRPLLKVVFKIIEGANTGDEVEEAFAVWMPDDGSKSGGWGKISRRKMETLRIAIGQEGQFQDFSILQNRPFLLETDLEFKAKKDEPGHFNTYTRVKTYKKYLGQGQAPGADANQPQAPVAPVAPAGPTAGFGGSFAIPQAPGGAFPAPAAPMGFPGAAPAPMAAPAGFTMPQAPAAPAPVAYAPQGFAPAAPGAFPAPAAPAPFQPAPGAPSPFGAPGR